MTSHRDQLHRAELSDDLILLRPIDLDDASDFTALRAAELPAAPAVVTARVEIEGDERSVVEGRDRAVM